MNDWNDEDIRDTKSILAPMHWRFHNKALGPAEQATFTSLCKREKQRLIDPTFKQELAVYSTSHGRLWGLQILGEHENL